MIGPTTYRAQAAPAGAHDCRDCKYFRETQVFMLCDHAEGKYSIAGKEDQHTVGHMRLHTCGGDARFFEPRA